MSDAYWLRQKQDTPLFPDLLWTRPQSAQSSGKLAIIGGDAHGFSAPGVAWSTALAARVGICKVLLPDAIKKLVKGALPDAEFAPSTPSGSFSKRALAECISLAQWSDLCMLAGDLGRNSETAIMAEDFVGRYSGLLTIAQDAVDYFVETPRLIADRKSTLIALSLSQLQKMFIATPSITPITYGMSTQQLVEALHDYTIEHRATLVTKHNDLLFIAANGRVATQVYTEKIWRTEKAARASVFWLQNPENAFEAIVSSLTNE